MGHGLQKYYSVTMASAGTLTAELDLGRSYGTMYLMVPTMTSNTQMFVQGCDVTAGTYRRIKMPVINTSTVAAPNDFNIASAATNCFVPIPNGFRYMKIETTATVDSGQTFKVICGD